MNDPVKIVDRTFMSGVATAIYAVQTAEAGTAYMSVARSNHGNEKRVVIIVDAGRFRAAWRAATGPAWRGALHRWFGTWHDGSPEGEARMQARYRKRKEKLAARQARTAAKGATE